MNQIIKNQINLLEKIIALGKKIPSDIDNLGKIQLPDDKEDLQRAIFLNYQKFYIENFFDFATFLLEKIENDEKRNFQYYVPLLRVFMEIYTDLLYLVNQTNERQAILVISSHLFTLAKYIQFGENKLSDESAELTRQYQEELAQDSDLIKHLNIPSNPMILSKEFMKKNSLLFPNKEIIINQFFIDCSPITRSIFKMTTKENFYEAYRTLSDYVHGAVFSLMKKDESSVNEQFWLIVRLEMFSMLMIELANQKIIQNKRLDEFNLWLSDFKKNNSDFVGYWKDIKMGNI